MHYICKIRRLCHVYCFSNLPSRKYFNFGKKKWKNNVRKFSLEAILSKSSEYSRLVAFAACSIGMMFVGASHTMFLSFLYRDYTSVGEDEKIPDELNDFAFKLFSTFKFPKDQSNVSFFSSNKLDPCIFGSINMRTGAAIGIPSYFWSKQISNLGISSDIISKHEAEILECLQLSRHAKAFVLCKSISIANNYSVYLLDIFYCLSFLLPYTFGSRLYHKLQMRHRVPLPLRLTLYFCLGMLGYSLYFSSSRLYLLFRDRSAEKLCVKLDRNIHLGAIEYYEKMERLRALMVRQSNSNSLLSLLIPSQVTYNPRTRLNTLFTMQEKMEVTQS